MAKQVTKYESDGATLAAASYNEGTVLDGAATAARRIWWKNTSTASETLANTRFRRVGITGNDGLNYLEIAADVPIALPGAPTVSLTAGGLCDVGLHKVAVGYKSANGETGPGATSNATTDASNKTIRVNRPGTPADATHWVVYMSKAGLTALYKVAEVAIGTTTYDISIADSGLTTAATSLNASGKAGTWGTANLDIGNLAVNAFAACWMRYNVPVGTTQAGNPRRAYAQFEET